VSSPFSHANVCSRFLAAASARASLSSLAWIFSSRVFLRTGRPLHGTGGGGAPPPPPLRRSVAPSAGPAIRAYTWSAARIHKTAATPAGITARAHDVCIPGGYASTGGRAGLTAFIGLDRPGHAGACKFLYERSVWLPEAYTAWTAGRNVRSPGGPAGYRAPECIPGASASGRCESSPGVLSDLRNSKSRPILAGYVRTQRYF